MSPLRVTDSRTHHHHLHSHPQLHNAAHWAVCALLTGMFLDSTSTVTRKRFPLLIHSLQKQKWLLFPGLTCHTGL